MARKKQGVKDKYYYLAKEQGYRARSCFKLIQMNRKFGFLEKATRTIDLCAAPGGWLQVAVKAMPRTSDTQIIGVDLLPIKAVRGCVTFQEDITTAKCRSIIRNEMKGSKADVVLCDGAPNVGADYTKDAFVQSELVIHALRFATDHLKQGGTFVTKVFRSGDYNALMWAFQQFFKKVDATKPASSRNVSAEIFVVCQGYLAPDKIDPKLLDPKYALAQVEPDVNDSAKALTELFHKKTTQKKNRQGYDESLGQTLFKSMTATEFVTSPDPILSLARSNAVYFEKGCEALAKHALTKDDVKEYLSDLRVLGKTELKNLLKWRIAMVKYLGGIKAQKREEDAAAAAKELEEEEATSKVVAMEEDGVEVSDADSEDNGNSDDEGDDSAEEDELDAEMNAVEKTALAKLRREKKRRAREHARRQARKDLGLENEFAQDVSELTGPFRLKDLGLETQADLDQVREVNISKTHSSQIASGEDGDADGFEMNLGDEGGEAAAVGNNKTAIRQTGVDSDEEEDYLEALEHQMDTYYEKFKAKREQTEPRTVQQRRMEIHADRLAKRKKAALETMQEVDMAEELEREEATELGRGAYLKLLAKGMKRKDDDDEDHSSSSEDEEEVENELAAAVLKSRTVKNPMIAPGPDGKRGEVPAADARAKRWFSQALFDGAVDEKDMEESDSEEEEEDHDLMPLPSELTDKAKRHEKRIKVIARKEKKDRAKAEKQAKLAKSFDPDAAASKFETVPREVTIDSDRESGSDNDDDEVITRAYPNTPKGQRMRKKAEKEVAAEKRRKANDKKGRALISAGMGKSYQGKEAGEGDEEATTGGGGKANFEVVPRDADVASDDEDSDMEGEKPLEYNSEDYDTDERATHVAVGALMTRPSRKRKMLDAAYNRYAFNDDNLPDWFAEDESRHNRPQIPVTKEMVDAIKARYKDLAAKPTHKVAEARARKKRRLVQKIDGIKRKASAIADQPDLTARSKMRAIEKVYKGAKVERPNAVFVVAKKNGQKSSSGKSKGGANVKLVDKRLKADTRSLKAIEKRQKKKGGKKSKGGRR